MITEILQPLSKSNKAGRLNFSFFYPNKTFFVFLKLNCHKSLLIYLMHERKTILRVIRWFTYRCWFSFCTKSCFQSLNVIEYVVLTDKTASKGPGLGSKSMETSVKDPGQSIRTNLTLENSLENTLTLISEEDNPEDAKKT